MQSLPEKIKCSATVITGVKFDKIVRKFSKNTLDVFQKITDNFY